MELLYLYICADAGISEKLFLEMPEIEFDSLFLPAELGFKFKFKTNLSKFRRTYKAPEDPPVLNNQPPVRSLSHLQQRTIEENPVITVNSNPVLAPIPVENERNLINNAEIGSKQGKLNRVFSNNFQQFLSMRYHKTWFFLCLCKIYIYSSIICNHSMFIEYINCTKID